MVFAIHWHDQPWVYMCSPTWAPFHLLPHPIPQGLPSALAISTLSHASDLDWWSISHMVSNIHVSMLFLQIIPPSPSPTESKHLFFTSMSLLLSRTWGHRYHLSKFHIWILSHAGLRQDPPAMILLKPFVKRGTV